MFKLDYFFIISFMLTLSFFVNSMEKTKRKSKRLSNNIKNELIQKKLINNAIDKDLKNNELDEEKDSSDNLQEELTAQPTILNANNQAALNVSSDNAINTPQTFTTSNQISSSKNNYAKKSVKQELEEITGIKCNEECLTGYVIGCITTAGAGAAFAFSLFKILATKGKTS